MKSLILALTITLAAVSIALAASTLNKDNNGASIQGFTPKTTTSNTGSKFTKDTTLLLAVRTRCTAATKLRIGSTTSAQFPIDADTSETTVIARGVTYLQYSSAAGTTCYMQDH